jgi:hypothetical protein
MKNQKPQFRRPADVQRRRFFRNLLGEMVSTCQEIGGHPQLKAGDLAQLPDAVLRQMVPVLKPGQSIKVQGGRLLFYRRETDAYEAVSRLRPEQQQFIRAMDGRSTLEQLAHQVATACGVPSSAAYRVVKPFFCLLARFGVCTPRDAYLEGATGRQEIDGVPL